MKRRLFALLLVLSVCLCACACAESASEKPILFRGIQWGTPYQEVMESYKVGTTSIWKPDGINAMFFGEEAKHYGELGIQVTSDVPDKEKVAGYNVEDVVFNFCYTPDESGLLAKDTDHAVLCFAKYKLDFNSKKDDYDAALEDLTAKLSRLYGDIDSQPSSAYGSRAVWKGAEGTLVSLYTYRGSYLNGGNYYVIEIRYSFEGMETLLEDAKKAEDLEFSTLTDGL